jgi:hypothetical protein
MRINLTGLVAAVGLALPAQAAPFVAVDASPSFVAMLDRGSVKPVSDKLEAEALVVAAKGQVMIAQVRFDCGRRAWQTLSERMVKPDLTATPPRLLSGPPQTVSPGSIGESLLEMACFNRLKNQTGGWSRPTLKEAIDAGRAIMARESGAR